MFIKLLDPWIGGDKGRFSRGAKIMNPIVE